MTRTRSTPSKESNDLPELEVEGLDVAPGRPFGAEDVEQGRAPRNRTWMPTMLIALGVIAAVVVVGTTGEDSAGPPATSVPPASTTTVERRRASPPVTVADVPSEVRIATAAADADAGTRAAGALLSGTQLRALVRRAGGPLALVVGDAATGTIEQFVALPGLTGERFQIMPVDDGTFVTDGAASSIVVTPDGTERRVNGAVRSTVFPSSNPGELWAVSNPDLVALVPELRRVRIDDGRIAARITLPAASTPIGDSGDGGFLVAVVSEGTYRFAPGEPPAPVAEGLVIGAHGTTRLENVCDEQLACTTHIRSTIDPDKATPLPAPLELSTPGTLLTAPGEATAALLTRSDPAARLVVVDLASGTWQPVPGSAEEALRYGAGSIAWSADGASLLWTTSERLLVWPVAGEALPSSIPFTDADEAPLDVVAFVTSPLATPAPAA